MSKARSPRLVCSTTIGTKPIPLPYCLSRGCRSLVSPSTDTQKTLGGQPLEELVHCFLSAQLFSNSSQPTIVSQTLPQYFNRFTCLIRQQLQLRFHLFVGNLNVLNRRNAIQN